MDVQVSILIPTYNRVHLLRKAILSALNQTYPNIEVVVRNNASSDRTRELCRRISQEDHRLKYFENDSNIGLSLNWKKVINDAEGDYVLFLSDDDLLSNTAIELFVEGIKKHPSANLIYGNYVLTNSLGNPVLECEDVNGMTDLDYYSEDGSTFIVERLRSRRNIVPCCVCHKRKVALERDAYQDVGGLLDLIGHMIIAADSEVVHVKATVANYRIHKNSYSQAKLRSVIAEHLMVLNRFAEFDVLVDYSAGFKLYCLRFFKGKIKISLLRQEKELYDYMVNSIRTLEPDYKPPYFYFYTLLYPFYWLYKHMAEIR